MTGRAEGSLDQGKLGCRRKRCRRYRSATAVQIRRGLAGWLGLNGGARPHPLSLPSTLRYAAADPDDAKSTKVQRYSMEFKDFGQKIKKFIYHGSTQTGAKT